MVKIYAGLVVKGKKKIEQVPENIRMEVWELVKEILKAQNIDGEC